MRSSAEVVPVKNGFHDVCPSVSGPLAAICTGLFSLLVNAEITINISA
jgi:hypothetical protein